MAYVVGAEVGAGELREHLRGRLPEWMVPSAFVRLERMPLTANNKVDRRALPEPEGGRDGVDTPFAPPRDVLELQLVQLWETILGVHPISITDSFFELGGHSLAAARLMAEIQARFGRSLPLSVLFQRQTAEGLADALRQQFDSQPPSSLVAIQPRGAKPPFFCVHPGGGQVLCYLELARHLGPEQPFYGFQSQGLEGEAELLTRVEDMAAHYVNALRSLQPEGPYLLGGWSFGGLIAFEMASQLLRSGAEVAMLALLDTHSSIPSRPEGLPDYDDATLMANFIWDLRGIYSLDISYDDLKALPVDEQLKHFWRQAKEAGAVPPAIELAQLRRLFEVFKTNFRAAQNYRPQFYPQPVTLLRADEQLSEGEQDPALGWNEFAVAVEVHTVPGNHYTILREPHIKTLAEELEKCIGDSLKRG